MYPRSLEMAGLRLASWDLALCAGVLLGYVVLRISGRGDSRASSLRFLGLRYAVTVYVCIVGAKLFAYGFDTSTSVFPQRSVTWYSYYLDPLSGPKTLYGAVVFLPVAILLVGGWRSKERHAHLLANWTPAFMVVLAGARLGCFLQSCCYGTTSEWFGVVFPAGSIVYSRQVSSGLISAGQATLPVVPTQALSAIACALIAAWSYARLRRGNAYVFVPAFLAYAAFRFALEFVRADPDRNFFGVLSTAQWTSLALFLTHGAYRTQLKVRTARLRARP